MSAVSPSSPRDVHLPHGARGSAPAGAAAAPARSQVGQEVATRARESGSEDRDKMRTAIFHKNIGTFLKGLAALAVFALIVGALIITHGGAIPLLLLYGKSFAVVAIPTLLIFGAIGWVGKELVRKAEADAHDAMIPETTKKFESLEAQVLGEDKHLLVEDIQTASIDSDRARELKNITSQPLTLSIPLDELNQLRAEQLDRTVWKTKVVRDACSQGPLLAAYDHAIAKLQTLLPHAGTEAQKKDIIHEIKILQNVKQSWINTVCKNPDNNPDVIEIQGQLGQDARDLLAVKEKIWKLSWPKPQTTPAIQPSIALDNAALQALQSQLTASPAQQAARLVTDRVLAEGQKKELRLEQEELQGQVLEAVTIYLEKNPNATAGEVDKLITSLKDGIQKFVDDPQKLKHHRDDAERCFYALRGEVMRCAREGVLMRTPEQWNNAFTERAAWEKEVFPYRP